MNDAQSRLTLAIAATALLWAGTALAGATDAEKCEAAKLKEAGKYALCRMKAESKAVAEGSKSRFFTNLHASLAPCMRSIPESSHSTLRGP